MAHEVKFLATAGIVVTMLVSNAGIASGQESDAATVSESQSPWSVTAALGFALVGAGNAVERNMTASGFNRDTPPGSGFFGRTSGQAYPFSEIGTQWALSARYTFSPPFMVGFMLSSGSLGSTTGQSWDGPFWHVSVKYHATIVAGVAGLNIKNGLRLCVGPAMYFTESVGDLGPLSPRNTMKASRLGGIAELGISTPSRSLLFLDIVFQYRYVGPITVGPFEGNSWDGVVTLPACDASFSHFSIGAGMGIRF